MWITSMDAVAYYREDVVGTIVTDDEFEGMFLASLSQTNEHSRFASRI